MTVYFVHILELVKKIVIVKQFINNLLKNYININLIKKL